jgi:hypothetical protein
VQPFDNIFQPQKVDILAKIKYSLISLSMIEKLTDEKLILLCKQFGAQALESRRKFLGLLPEVNKRRLYEKNGFNSIFEFAAKLGGVSEEQVRTVIHLERKFEDKPKLQTMLISGEVSVNKLVRVAAIATSENQNELAELLKILPQKAIDNACT